MQRNRNPYSLPRWRRPFAHLDSDALVRGRAPQARSSPHEITQYGGDTQGAADETSLDFHADEHTADIVPAAKTNIWTMAVEPGATFTYGLRREEQDRRFRVEFDLSNPVEAPPAPWGHE
jgi:hypothetical protein